MQPAAPGGVGQGRASAGTLRPNEAETGEPGALDRLATGTECDIELVAVHRHHGTAVGGARCKIETLRARCDVARILATKVKLNRIQACLAGLQGHLPAAVPLALYRWIPRANSDSRRWRRKPTGGVWDWG